MATIEDKFALQLDNAGIPYIREYSAISGRKYRWDFYLPHVNTLIEIQGGTWARKRTGHSTGPGIQRDCRKLNIAGKYGYVTLAFTSDMVLNNEAINFLIEFLEEKCTEEKRQNIHINTKDQK